MHPSDAVFSHVALGARGAIATGSHAGLMQQNLKDEMDPKRF